MSIIFVQSPILSLKCAIYFTPLFKTQKIKPYKCHFWKSLEMTIILKAHPAVVPKKRHPVVVPKKRHPVVVPKNRHPVVVP